MKIRLTILTENNIPIPDDREKVLYLTKKAWEVTLNTISLFAENEDKATVESVEIVEDSDEDG